MTRTCTRCGSIVTPDAVRCPVCGAHPDVGALVVRKEHALARPARQLALPVAASAVALAAAGAGISLARRLFRDIQISRKPREAQPPARIEDAPQRGRVIAIRRRFWAMGDSSGAGRWGAEETVWEEAAD